MGGRSEAAGAGGGGAGPRRPPAPPSALPGGAARGLPPSCCAGPSSVRVAQQQERPAGPRAFLLSKMSPTARRPAFLRQPLAKAPPQSREQTPPPRAPGPGSVGAAASVQSAGTQAMGQLRGSGAGPRSPSKVPTHPPLQEVSLRVCSCSPVL